MADGEYRHKISIRCGRCHRRLTLVATAVRAAYRCETCGVDDVVASAIDWENPPESDGGNQ